MNSNDPSPETPEPGTPQAVHDEPDGAQCRGRRPGRAGALLRRAALSAALLACNSESKAPTAAEPAGDTPGYDGPAHREPDEDEPADGPAPAQATPRGRIKIGLGPGSVGSVEAPDTPAQAPEPFQLPASNGEILGIELGMSVDEVLAVLEGRNAKIKEVGFASLDERFGSVREVQGTLQTLQSNQMPKSAVRRLSAALPGSGTDYVTVDFAQLPDDNRVLEVERRANFGTDRSSRAIYQDALVAKFGPPHSAQELGTIGGPEKKIYAILPLWVYPAGAPTCGATHHSSGANAERRELQKSHKTVPESCGSVLAFEVSGDPVGSSRSRLANAGALIVNRERHNHFMENWRRKLHEERVKNAVAKPTL